MKADKDNPRFSLCDKSTKQNYCLLSPQALAFAGENASSVLRPVICATMKKEVWNLLGEVQSSDCKVEWSWSIDSPCLKKPQSSSSKNEELHLKISRLTHVGLKTVKFYTWLNRAVERGSSNAWQSPIISRYSIPVTQVSAFFSALHVRNLNPCFTHANVIIWYCDAARRYLGSRRSLLYINSTCLLTTIVTKTLVSQSAHILRRCTCLCRVWKHP